MKLLALDLGDKWIGSAIADPLGITCKPYKTIELEELEHFLNQTIKQEDISTIIVGYPQTFACKESEQTKKIVTLKETLEKKFSNVTWILWDERLSSKHAEQLKRTKSTDDKKKSHSIAAAFILQSYLDQQAASRNEGNNND
ncbi:MAG: Holliday junction resolvase RuvX [bacterium]